MLNTTRGLIFGVAALISSVASGQHVDQHYPDFGFLPPPDKYLGRVFVLSQKYPLIEPTLERRPSFMKIDFKKQWREYLLEAREYCFKENVLGGNPENDFDAALRKTPTWFHMPWQHYGPKGREGIHGLTKEAKVEMQQLSSTQTFEGGQTYAVALFNEFGGYTIGKVWADKQHPDDSDIRFPVGTVIVKVLFVDVPPDQVPSLTRPLQWKAYVTTDYKSTERVFKTLSLIQMDVMVRHSEKDAPAGWVFGTYQYNSAIEADNPWKRLVPVGVQWGNDPSVKGDDHTNPVAFATKRNPALKESIINPDDKELPPTHLGWNGRLNGPVDNTLSSCMSCHMTAQVPARSPLHPTFVRPPEVAPARGSDEWMRWFRNLECGDRFDSKLPTKSTDFCLQMSMALQNFRDWRNAGSKFVADRYKRNQKSRSDPDREFRISRDSEGGTFD